MSDSDKRQLQAMPNDLHNPPPHVNTPRTDAKQNQLIKVLDAHLMTHEVALLEMILHARTLEEELVARSAGGTTIEGALREIAAMMDEAEALVASERLGGNIVKEAAAKGQLVGLRQARAVLTTPSVASSATASIYTQDQQRAADYICEASDQNIGGGEDPVGFLIVSHRVLRAAVEDMKAWLACKPGSVGRSDLRYSPGVVLLLGDDRIMPDDDMTNDPEPL